MKRALRTALVGLTVAWLIPGTLTAEWRRVGTAALDLRLSGLATGPVDRVGWSADGATLYTRSITGPWFGLSDTSEDWKQVSGEPVEPANGVATRLPEPSAKVIEGGRSGLLYAAGLHVWRSEDGGRSWRNLTQWKQTSLLGGPISDLAARPRAPEEIAVAAATGVWRSTDGGLSWMSLNASLPQMPVRRIVSLPQGIAGVRVAMLAPSSLAPAVFEWAPGERRAWQPVSGVLGLEQAVRRSLSREFGANVSTLAYAGDVVYAGFEDGRILVSLDRGSSWLPPAFNPGAAVEAFALDPREPRRALAALRRSAANGPVILQTTNGGLAWYSISRDLGQAAVFGIAADFNAGAVYAATEGGIFVSETDLSALGAPAAWRKLEGGLPQAPVLDVKLDPSHQTLYAAVFGYGVYTNAALHSRRDLRIVSSADWSPRPAAPGALLSVIGGKVTQVRAGERTAPVLSRGEREIQFQLPFDLDGSSVTLALEAESGVVESRLPLLPAAPAILVDRDGTPMLMDSASGAMLDAENPARPGGVVQILVSGLGRVQPEWPAGLAAPAGVRPEQMPAVALPVRAFLDGTPVEVLLATLAPGYIGYYLVEVRLPEIVNAGPAELFLNAGNSESNRVRLYIEP